MQLIELWVDLLDRQAAVLEEATEQLAAVRKIGGDIDPALQDFRRALHTLEATIDLAPWSALIVYVHRTACRGQA